MQERWNDYEHHAERDEYKMQIFVNEQPHELSDGATVAELLDRLALADKPVAVELNRHVVPKARHHEQTLTAGDRLEIVTLVGGG